LQLFHINVGIFVMLMTSFLGLFSSAAVPSSTIFGPLKGLSPYLLTRDPGSSASSLAIVIGHGIGGKYIPIMARLAEARRWSKRRQTCLSSPDITAIHNE